MCGIVALTMTEGRVPDAVRLRHMAESLAHRGPDDEGCFVDAGVGLYHKRLSIIDPACGHQPMRLGPFTIVHNGEIYNYVELRRQLESRGHRFETDSDTEVALRLYAEHGASFVEQLNGMFAIVIHDRDRDRLVVVRDRLGIKPMYYRAGSDGVHFASEIKALLRYPGVEASLDRQALEDYLTFQYALGDRTLFSGIRKLLPAHRCVVDLRSGAYRVERYWDIDYRIAWDRTAEESTEALRALIEDAVHLQMRSDVPVGAHLSGGLDSSLVTVLAGRQHPAGLQAFHGAFAEGEAFDEREYARAVARSSGVTLHELVPTARDFVDTMPRLAWHMDEPTAGPGIFPQYMVSRLASEHVRVVLGGQGGDEIFGGYARYLVAYLEQALKGAILETNEEGEHIVSLASIVPSLPSLRQYVPMLRQFWGEGLFEPMDRRYFRLLDRLGGDASLLTPDLRASLDPDGVFDRFAAIFNHPDTESYVNKMTHFDLVTGLPSLLQVEDRVSMAVSLESRVPLLDHRIVEFAAAMPPALKFRGGDLKHALKRAASGVVPERVLERKDKMGFPVPLHLWAAGPLREFFHDILLSGPARGRGIFAPAEVGRLLEDERAFGRRLWAVLNLELWHRNFIDAKATAEPVAAPPVRSVTELSYASGGA